MFELTPEQSDIRKAAREFAEKEFTDIARELDAGEQFEDKLWKKAAELGFLAMFIEEEYGGAGMGHLDQCIVIEEFARVDTGIAQCMVAAYFGTQRHRGIRQSGHGNCPVHGSGLFWDPARKTLWDRGTKEEVSAGCLLRKMEVRNGLYGA